MSIENKILNAALEYYDIGWCPIPAKKGEKSPCILWKEYQNNRPIKDEIFGWFNSEDLNIFVPTGSEFIVIDIDTNEHGLLSDEAEDLISKLPATRVSKTGSGKHFFFKNPKGLKIPSKVGILPGVDVRGEGGGVIVPPSIHPNGNEYIWVDEFELADFPDELFNNLLKEGASRYEGKEPQLSKIYEGNRNSTLISFAGMIYKQLGNKPELAKRLVHLLNHDICVPPLPDDELEKTILASMEKYHPASHDVREWLKPLLVQEILEIETAPSSYLVNQLIPQNATTVLSGDPGNYKTWLLLEIAKSVASGEGLFKYFSVASSGVWLIDKENNINLLQSRLKMLGIGKQLPIYVSCTRDFTLSSNNIDEIINFAKEKNIKAIMFDSLRRVHSGNENDSKDIAKVFELANRLHLYEITVIFTHHHKKSQGQAMTSLEKIRGSSDILASIDSHLIVERSGNGVLKISQNKNRFDPELKPFTLAIDTDGKTKFSFQYTGESLPKLAKQDEVEDYILEQLKELNSMSRMKLVDEVENKFGFDHNIVDRAVSALIEKGTIEKVLNGRKATYKLKEKI